MISATCLHAPGSAKIGVEQKLAALLTDRVGGVLRALKLHTPHEDIVHARVALLKHPRHLHGSDEGRGFLTLSGKSLQVVR